MTDTHKMVLEELVDWLKLHKMTILHGTSRREQEHLMDLLHRANQLQLKDTSKR